MFTVDVAVCAEVREFAEDDGRPPDREEICLGLAEERVVSHDLRAVSGLARSADDLEWTNGKWKT